MARARAGDAGAYDVLVARYAVAAVRTAALLGAGSDAEDVAQEAFVKAYTALGRFRPGAAFRPWLLAIVANEARNACRARRRRDRLTLRAATLSGPSPSEPDPGQTAVQQERRERLLAAVRSLPVDQREVVVCRYFLDLSEAETAQVLHRPKGTVKSRLSRALDALETRLESPESPESPESEGAAHA